MLSLATLHLLCIVIVLGLSTPALAAPRGPQLAPRLFKLSWCGDGPRGVSINNRVEHAMRVLENAEQLVGELNTTAEFTSPEVQNYQQTVHIAWGMYLRAPSR